MIRRFGLVAEAVVARAHVHLEQVGRARGAVAVADAVVAGEVRRGLGRGDQVVARRARATECGSAHSLDLGAELLAPARASRSKRRAHAGLDPLAPFSSLGHADPHALRGRSRSGSSTGSGTSTEVESHGSRPPMIAREQRGVADVARHRADLVEARGEGDDAVARDGAVGRLAARRSPQNAAGWRIEPPVSEPSAHGASPARRPRRSRRRSRPGRAPVPRVARRAVGGVLGRGAHRELVRVGLAEQRRAGRLAAARRRSRVRRAVALEDLRARLARDALGADEVLDRDRHAAERRRAPRLAAAPRRRPR